MNRIDGSMATVLIITSSNDVHSDEIESKLRGSGASIIRLNTDQLISRCSELVFTDKQDDSEVVVNDMSFNLSEITSVWYRRPETPETKVEDPGQRQFAEHELSELLQQLYFKLGNSFWVSDYQALDAARRKLPQLHIARSLGMAVPKTLATNSPRRIRSFYNECAGRVVYKTLHAPVIKPSSGPELWGVPTTIIGNDYISQIDLIRHTGGIFQEYIDKAYEIRVTVIGEEIFAAKINSQVEPTAQTDWRSAVAYGLVEVTPYELPDTVAKQCRSIITSYGLNFGAIDIIKSSNDEYVFLELNCNGQWLWVEEATGQPLSTAMVKLLTNTKNSCIFPCRARF